MEYLIVAIGGGIGAALRHFSNVVLLRTLGSDFPWGTVFVNLAGSFLMGLFVEAMARRYGVSNEMRLLIATGFLGGFTTFSSFSLDTALLYERGELLMAASYVIGSVGLGILGLFAGLALGRVLT